MEVTDPKVKRLLARANSEALWSHIDAYPDDEIEGLTEMDVFIDELEYLIWLYEEDGNEQHKRWECRLRQHAVYLLGCLGPLLAYSDTHHNGQEHEHDVLHQ